MVNRELLIVDDEHNILSSLKRELKQEGYTIHLASSGKEGLGLVKTHDIGVILSDFMMPEMDGVTFLETVRHHKPDVVRILLTGFGNLNNVMDAVNRSRVFGYLTKPWSSEVLKGTISQAFEYYHLTMENKRLQKLTKAQNGQLKSMNENLENMIHKRTRQLEEAVREGVLMLAMAAEARDDDTGDHINRIRTLTKDICLGLGMPEEESELISYSSIMHDVGKIHIPDKILKKPGALSDEEWEIMKTHTIAGEKILGKKPFYRIARCIARSHHERWNGSGYPDGLKGTSIPQAARIVTVADVFDALTHQRPYKPAWPVEKAIDEMKGLSGKLFDPEILKVFIGLTIDN